MICWRLWLIRGYELRKLNFSPMATAKSYLKTTVKVLRTGFSALVIFLLIILAPWQTNHHAIISILEAENKCEMDRLTAQWQNSKVAELRSVSTTVRSNLQFDPDSFTHIEQLAVCLGCCCDRLCILVDGRNVSIMANRCTLGCRHCIRLDSVDSQHPAVCKHISLE